MRIWYSNCAVVVVLIMIIKLMMIINNEGNENHGINHVDDYDR